jgi:hypothetical protein
MNYVEEMKTFLREFTIDLYNIRARDLKPEDLPTLYRNMGYLLQRVEESTTMEGIIGDVKMGRYSELGFSWERDLAVDEFMELFLDHIRIKQQLQ